MKNNIEKGIFINNLEAVDIANHVERERSFEFNYKGVLPYSLELIKLNTLEDFSTKKYVNLDKNIFDRLISDDVINVKFSCGQMDRQETIDYITKKTIKRVFNKKKYNKNKESDYLAKMKLDYEEEYIKLNNTIDKIKNDDKHEYNKTTEKQLRNKLYENGFIITKVIYPNLIKGHEKYNKEVVEAIKTQKKLSKELEKKIKKSKNVIEKTSLEQQKEEIDKGIKLAFENLEKETVKTFYKMWKRSSSKSRTGQVLFIKDSLLEEMNNWGRMALNLPTNEKGFDVVGLSAYSSLVGSHIEGILNIKPSNILIISDVLSCFDMKANVVRKEPLKYNKFTLKKSKEELNEATTQLIDLLSIMKKTKASARKVKYSNIYKKITTLQKQRHLKMYEEITKIESSLFDGQSLLDSRYFKEGQAMMLLRQAFFKSASFNTEVVKFLKDWFGNKYDKADIKDMFGNRIRVNQIHMIITPNSLKALKFSKYCKQDEETGAYIGTNNDMWKYWKEIVRQDKNCFGICKHEKESKQGCDSDENVIQQMSYQHINSLRADKESIKSLLDWEINYINSAKSDIKVYKDLLLRDSNYMNSNEMLAKLCDTDYVNTEMFRKQRAKAISKYVNKIKGGKVKVSSDNCVIIGNPHTMLLHSVNGLKDYGNLNNKGEFILNKDFEDVTLPSNKDYISCYTKLYENNEVICEFRNPHTSYSNIGLLKNVRKECNFFDKYFNFTKNIIVVNLINTEFQLVNSGSDQDSDFILCSNNSYLKEICEKSFRKDLPCVCDIPSQSNDYMLTNTDMALMDSKLSESKDIIGTVVNLGQLAMSEYYHTINTMDKDDEEQKERLKKLEEIVAIMTILSGCSIDNAKRTYDISMIAEINNVIKTGLIKQKPNFWEYVSKSTKAKNEEIRKSNKGDDDLESKLKTTKMECPMEYISEILNDKEVIPKAEDDTKNNMELKDVIKEIDGKAKGEVTEFVLEINEILDNEITAYQTAMKKERNRDERQRQTLVLEDTYESVIKELKKRKINEKCMQMILKKYVIDENSNVYYKTRLMNVLYTNNEETFINLFHKSN